MFFILIVFSMTYVHAKVILEKVIKSSVLKLMLFTIVSDAQIPPFIDNAGNQIFFLGENGLKPPKENLGKQLSSWASNCFYLLAQWTCNFSN